jgi:hypothetical protein
LTGVLQKLIGAVALCLLAAAGYAAAPTRAYNDYDNIPCVWPYGGGQELLYIFWKNHPSYPPPGDYATAMANGHNTWWNTATPTYFYYWPSVSGNTEGVAYFGGTWLGVVSFPASCSPLVYELWLNRSNLDNQGWHKLQYTANHELGHVATAGHSTQVALMRGSYNPSYSYWPSSDDLCAINTKYISTKWPATGCSHPH